MRFVEDGRKIKSQCTVCGVSMWLPPSKAGKYLRCGAHCISVHRASVQKKAKRQSTLRIRPCMTCGSEFSPRATQVRAGQGIFCSQRCNTKSRAAMHAPDARMKAVETWRASEAAGRFCVPTGDLHPRWSGGRAASARRAIENGNKAAGTKKYRAENPHKVREFSQKRAGRKTGRLPRGTVARQGELQGWRCFVCDVDILQRYHMDHWMPLALNGKHEPQNIRLLCPTCNVRKGAKHPDRFLRERAIGLSQC